MLNEGRRKALVPLKHVSHENAFKVYRLFHVRSHHSSTARSRQCKQHPPMESPLYQFTQCHVPLSLGKEVHNFPFISLIPGTSEQCDCEMLPITQVIDVLYIC
jgi:hypothetical protein